MRFLTLMCFGLSIVVSSQSGAAILLPNPVFTTEGDIDASAFLPPTGSRLLDITQFSAAGSNSGIFTNQYTGIAGRTGLVRSVIAAPVGSAIDGIPFNAVAGPNGGTLVAFAGLEGMFAGGGPGSINFTSGKLIIAETFGAFDRRNPSTFGFAGATVLGTYDLALAPFVAPGPDGTQLAPVPLPGQNISLFDGLTIGNTDFNFLVVDDGTGDFLNNVANAFPNPALIPNPATGFFIEGEQDLAVDAVGLNADLNAPGFILDGTDLGVLNAIAGAAGLSNLLGAGTGFATGLGLASVSPTTDFFADPLGLAGGTGEGDLLATATEANINPIIEGYVPEPTMFLIWSGFVTIATLGTHRRRSNV